MPGKNPTVKSLKIGDTLSFGAYSAQGQGENPVPILWIKASTNCDFITERVIDCLEFDARENWGPEYRPAGVPPTYMHFRNVGGDPNYPQSNIFQFLNSAEDADEWFIPTHAVDAQPSYAKHAGFLRYFSQAEMDALEERTVSCENGLATGLVHLLSHEDVYGDEKLPLFRKRRGIRAKPTIDMYLSPRNWYAQDHYAEYMLRSRYDYGIGSVCSDAYNHMKRPEMACGVRPIVRLDPNAKIAIGPEGKWKVMPRRRRTARTDLQIPDNALDFIGLV